MKMQLITPVALAVFATYASAKVLNDGTDFRYGKGFDNQVDWQMAGEFESFLTLPDLS